MQVNTTEWSIAFESEDRITSIWDDGDVIVEHNAKGFWSDEYAEPTPEQWRFLANIADKCAKKGGA